MISIGIDQSITGTGIVVLEDDRILYSELVAPQNNVIKFYKQIQKPLTSSLPFKRGLIDENGKNLKKVKDRTKEEKELFKVSQSERINFIADRLAYLVQEWNPDRVGMEDIAFGGTGQVASLGMIHGFLQRVLFQYQVPFKVVNIMRIKRYATGAANAHKNAMIEAIPDEEQQLLFKDIPEGNHNDMADAYHISRYIQNEVTKDELIL